MLPLSSKLPNPAATDFFLKKNLPATIYFHPSHGSSTTQRSCLISDSVNPFPLRLMSHEFTLLTPLIRSLVSRSLPTSLGFSTIITVKATEARRGGTDLSTKGLSQWAEYFWSILCKVGHQQPPLQGLQHSCSQFKLIFQSADHIHNNLCDQHGV